MKLAAVHSKKAAEDYLSAPAQPLVPCSFLSSPALLCLCRPLPAWEYKDYLGWSEQGDGRLAYGVFVQSGRIKGEIKKALRTLIERYELPVTISANQNLVLQDIDPSWKSDILDTLQKANIK